MPIILESKECETWLNSNMAQTDLAPLLKPCAEDLLAFYAKGTTVNNPRNEGPECLKKIESLRKEKDKKRA